MWTRLSPHPRPLISGTTPPSGFILHSKGVPPSPTLVIANHVIAPVSMVRKQTP